jgi:hypothetical protein
MVRADDEDMVKGLDKTSPPYIILLPRWLAFNTFCVKNQSTKKVLLKIKK